jgi:hypothetical protein
VDAELRLKVDINLDELIARVVELRAIVDQAASLAARTPEQPTTGGGGTTTGGAT